MTIQESLDIMCRRCENNEVCMGTGCEPRNTLQRLIDEVKNEKDNSVLESAEEFMNYIPLDDMEVENGHTIHEPREIS